MSKRKKNNIKYSGLIIILSLFLFAIFIYRLSYLSLSKEVDGVNLKELASRRTTATDLIYAKRGSIYAKNGDLLAQNVTAYKLIAYLEPKRTTNPKNPQHVIDKEKTAEKLSPILGIKKSKLLEYLSKKNVYQTEFGIKGKNLNEITKKKIEDLNLPGLDFIESYRRYYPKGDFASYTIGYAKTKTDEDEEVTGEMGIEKYYDKTLRGENGYIKYQKDLKGYKIADTKTETVDATSGKDIYLTIDSNLQFYVENAMTKQAKRFRWDWYTLTLLDAKSGAVLASSQKPSFDPNKRDIKNYMNMLTSAPYEPGSTMKTYTYMAAMENGVYKGSETYHSGVYTTKDGTQIGDWNRAGWGNITFDRGYVLSSNVGIINLIHRHMNANMLRSYYKKLGFGRKTGLPLPNESTGLLGFKYETEIYNAGFGQGITTTPIQNVKALTALTNDGMLLQPYIVDKIVDPETNEVILKNKRTELERVASTQTVKKMKQLMDECVNGVGNTGYYFRLDSKELIGKTGTAQIPDEKHGGYIPGVANVIVSFAGIYPKSDPKVIIYASVKKPTNGAQKPVSDAVKEIIKNLAKYYGKNEEKTKAIDVHDYEVPNFINKSIDETKNIIKQDKVSYVIYGKGSKVIKQIPNANTVVTNRDKIYLITNDSDIKVPDVKGMSSKIAKTLLEQLGLNVTLDGVGYVKKQSIKPNSKLEKGKEIKLTLTPKFKE